jgi:hypothetical protein
MIVMIKEERCASNGLLLEGKKKKPSNLLQRLGFDRPKEAKDFLITISTIYVSKPFFFLLVLKNIKHVLKKMKIK